MFRDTVGFRLDGGDEESAALVAELVAAGVAIGEWRLDGAGLEELFMQLTESPAPVTGNGEVMAGEVPTDEEGAT